MQLTVHCFADNAKISPSSYEFTYKGSAVQLISLPHPQDERKNQLTLRICRKITVEEIEEFKGKMSTKADTELYFFNRSRKYSEILLEVAHLIEGLLSILFGVAPPKFDTTMPMVNLIGETDEERDLLDSGEISRGFGYVSMPARYPLYQLEESIKDSILAASHHLPALSFISQAKRSFESNDHEVAFFLYFRIIDGYFSFGATKVEKELLRQESELSRYLPYDDRLIDAVSRILKEMNLTLHCNIDFSGLIKDIVHIRHKLTHFSSKNASSHHSPKIMVELATLNAYLDEACAAKLRDEIGIAFTQ